MRFEKDKNSTLEVSDFNDYVIDTCINNILKGTAEMFINNVHANDIAIVLPPVLFELLKDKTAASSYINEDKGYPNIWGFKVIQGHEDKIIIQNTGVSSLTGYLAKIKYPIEKLNWQDVNLDDLYL